MRWENTAALVPRLCATQNVGHRFDVIGRGAAATADQIHAVTLYKFLVPFRQLCWRQIIDCFTADVTWQPSIGQTRHPTSRVLAQVTNVAVHQVRTGGAVESDDVNRHRFHRRKRAGNIGTGKHGAGGFDGDLRLDRHFTSDVGHRLSRR